MSLNVVENVLTVENVPKKRGRKSKKDLEKQSILNGSLSNNTLSNQIIIDTKIRY